MRSRDHETHHQKKLPKSHTQEKETPMSTTKTRRSLSLLAAFAVAAGALALPAATSATQAAPAFGLAATTERAPSLVDLDTS